MQNSLKFAMKRTNTKFLKTNESISSETLQSGFTLKFLSFWFYDLSLRLQFRYDDHFQIFLLVVSTNDGPDMWTNKDINMTSSPLATSSRQYMETLKRNYFV